MRRDSESERLTQPKIARAASPAANAKDHSVTE